MDDAYKAGWIDGMKAEAGTYPDNPYHPSTIEYGEYFSGWCNGYAEQFDLQFP